MNNKNKYLLFLYNKYNEIITKEYNEALDHNANKHTEEIKIINV